MATRSESLPAQAWRRFRRTGRAMAGLLVVAVLTVLTILAPALAPYDRDATDLSRLEQPPSSAHPLGTDELGRDVLSRMLWGGRVSLTVGLVAVSISASIGVVVGAIAGYYGGWVDNLIMRLTDVVLAIPFLPLALTLAAVLPPSIYTTMAVIGVLSWPGTARLVRGEFLTLRQRDFVIAASAAGAPDRRIIWRHMLPNAVAPLLVSATLGVAGAVLSEAALSFLGLGVPQPVPSWGNMLSGAVGLKVLAFRPWMWVPPGIAIFLAVMAINVVGDGLRDALDPRMKE